jgi:3-(3-hydroxy-phenyl)propionate hydroxylase
MVSPVVDHRVSHHYGGYVSGTAPVVVVGAGPVGMVAAHLLGRYGVPTVVVERERAVHPLPRAVHLDDEAVRVLQAAGLERELGPHLRPIRGMQLVTAPGRPFWHFRDTSEPGPNGWPHSNMFHQPTIDRLLRETLDAREGVELRLGEEVEDVELRDDGALLRVRAVDGGGRSTLAAGTVLACDGARSTVRRLLGVAQRDRAFDQRWLVVDADADRPLDEHVVQQVCDPVRPATSVPITGHRHRWEWLLHPGEDEQELLAPAAFAARVAPWTGDRRVGVERGAVYRFHATRARRWRVGPVFLLGDAAHQMPPFLGQGLCAGIRDAANLTWKLALVRAGAVNGALLDTYERERAPHVDIVTSLAMLVGLMVRARGPAAGLLHAGFRVAARLPAGMRRPLEMVPTPGLRPGPLVVAGLRLPGLRAAGRPLPQPVVHAPGGGAVLLDELLGDGFALVGLGCDPLESLDAPSRGVWERLGTAVVRVDTREPGRKGAVVDRSGVLTAWYRRYGACVAVVRPDRYVLAACAGPGLPSLAEVTSGLEDRFVQRAEGRTARLGSGT